jgi:hypothetical protein
MPIYCWPRIQHLSRRFRGNGKELRTKSCPLCTQTPEQGKAIQRSVHCSAKRLWRGCENQIFRIRHRKPSIRHQPSTILTRLCPTSFCFVRFVPRADIRQRNGHVALGQKQWVFALNAALVAPREHMQLRQHCGVEPPVRDCPGGKPAQTFHEVADVRGFGHGLALSMQWRRIANLKVDLQLRTA